MSDDETIDSPPEGHDGWEEVWRRDLRVQTRRSPLAERLASWVRRLLWPELARQRDYNIAVLEMLADVRRDVAALHTDIETIDRDVKSIATEIGRRDERLRIVAARNDALVAAVDRRQEALAVRLRDVTNPVVRREGISEPARDDFVYRRLEDGLRGSESEIREALEPYVERAASAQPAVDVGCGRGEFLAMCAERGIDVRGFDTNERAVADLVTRGLPAALGAVPECLGKIADGSVGSILASHVVEHLPVDALLGLFAAAWRILKPGGLLMIETPNARSLAVGASEFWRDPTHLAPRHVGALTLVAREIGFTIDEVTTVHPHPAESRIELGDGHPRDLVDAFDRINALLFGDQDLRLVLKKPG